MPGTEANQEVAGNESQREAFKLFDIASEAERRHDFENHERMHERARAMMRVVNSESHLVEVSYQFPA